MRQLLWIFGALWIALPAFAQDDGPASPFAGGGGAQVFTRVDEVNPMDSVKTFLGKANIKLSGDQEKELKPAVDAAYKQMQDVSERMRAQFAGQRGPAGPRGERTGGFRGRGDGVGPAAANSPAFAELRQINDDLVAKINAVLQPEQQMALKKFQNDQIRTAGGFAALKLMMEEAGAPLTAEQEPQIQALYAEDAKQRAQLLRESQGQSDPAKAGELERTTMAKVARLLSPAQRKALLDSRAKSPQ
ncbi:MAG: hypothetical protein DMG13_19765 [Acidobacteria bacterium]|nr:MAG: hypothetical protein DMG13_19765 [Acidobacteriota bacterium]